MSIDDLIDIHSTAIKRRADVSRYDFSAKHGEDESGRTNRFKSKDYMEEYINPPELLRAEEDEDRKRREHTEHSFPEQLEKDVLLFLIEHAPVEGVATRRTRDNSRRGVLISCRKLKRRS